jgi:hypothetical protein
LGPSALRDVPENDALRINDALRVGLPALAVRSVFTPAIDAVAESRHDLDKGVHQSPQLLIKLGPENGISQINRSAN